MIVLPTNAKDDDFEGKRKWAQSVNDDGSVSMEDVTEYKTKGTEFGALEMNNINAAIMGFTTSDVDFRDDGSIVETDAYGKQKKTTFSKGEGGETIIQETLHEADGSMTRSKTTTISADGKKIKEVAAI